MRNWTLRIVGIAICILGLLFGGTINRFNFCLGDKVFSALGLPTWTNGTHYPAIIGLIIILVGIAFVNYTLQKRKRIVVWVITVLVLVVLNSDRLFVKSILDESAANI